MVNNRYKASDPKYMSKGFGTIKIDRQVYMKFLDKVLQAVAKSGVDKQRVYALLQRNLEKLDDGFADALHLWAKSKMARVMPTEAGNIAANISIFSTMIGQFPQGNRANNLEIAIAGYEICQTIFSLDFLPENWADTQINLGNTYSYRLRGETADNLEQAIHYYKQALLVFTRHAFPEGWADTQNSLGAAYLYRIFGEESVNLEKAIHYFNQALLVFTHDSFPEKWAKAQNNLGEAYRNPLLGENVSNLEQAINCYHQALLVSTIDEFPENWADTQNNLGEAYRNLSRILDDRVSNLEKAIHCYKQALRVFTRDKFPEKWAVTQNHLGIAYGDLISIPSIPNRANILASAIKCLTEVLQINTRDAFPYYYAKTKLNLGLVYQEYNQLSLAYDNFADAIDTVESLRNEIVKGGDEAKKKLAEDSIPLYQRMVEVCIELKNYTAAIEYVERSKARNLVELLANREIKPKGDIPETVLNELSRLSQEIYTEQRRQEIEERNRNISRTMMSETRFLGYRTQINQLQQQLNELITRDIKPIDPNFSLTQKVEPIPYSEIQSLTGEKTAILEWYITEDKFLTFIITPQSPTPIIWQSSTADLKKLIRWANGYIQAYRKKKKDLWKRRLTLRLRLLAKILHLDEILENIPKQCDRLILIPHQFLHLFPLHALPVSPETWLQFNPNSDSSPANPYLLDCFVGGVGYAPSCQLLQKAQMRKRPNFSHLFAIANPTKDRYLLELQAANISHQFQSNDFLAKDDANKNAILNGKLNFANCAHFGCHGKFEPNSPLESALKLANNERLTLLEILNLDLNQCRLVTLSACETGLTESSTSDEYIGLPFGFLLAGSPSMVSTLWEVDQLASTLLLIRFYENLKTLSTVTALNEAQQWLRNLTSEGLEALLKRLKPEIDRTFEQLSRKERTLYVDARLNGARNRQPFPFSEPHYWAGFMAIGV